MSRVILRNVAAMLVVSVSTLSASQGLQAQGRDQGHTATSADLYAAMDAAVETRTADTAAVRTFLSSELGTGVLKATMTDHARVDRAVATLTDAELARLASQAKTLGADFSAGALSRRALVSIAILTLATLLLVGTLRQAAAL